MSSHVFVIAVLAIVAGCSKSSSTDKAATDKAATDKPATSAGHQKINVCDAKYLTPADFTDVLPQPVTGTKPIGQDSCQFQTATADNEGGPSVEVTFRPWGGKMALAAWRDGSMNAKAEPLPDVGDDAVWIPSLHEVDVSKNGDLCAARPGGSALASRPSADLPAKLGAVCMKLFARL